MLELTKEEELEVTKRVAVFGMAVAQESLKIGHIVLNDDDEGIRYRIWADKDRNLFIEKYDKDDSRVQ